MILAAPYNPLVVSSGFELRINRYQVIVDGSQSGWRMSGKAKGAIVGLGVTKHGRIAGITARKFAAEACRLAIQEAGLRREDIDGYLFGNLASGFSEDSPARMLGLAPKIYWQMETGGSTAIAMLMVAMSAVEMGLANYVMCVFGDNAASVARSPLARSRPYGYDPAMARTGDAYGQFGPAGLFALMARRHMSLYGTTSRQLGAIAIQEREYAVINPEAFFYGQPMTMDDHQNSPMIVDPLRLLDCCLISDGGSAFIVTSPDRARDLRNRPVFVRGVGFSNQLRVTAAGRGADTFVESDARTAKEIAFKMAGGIELTDIDVAQLYDAFTIDIVLQLEDYGFCKRGEGGPFAEAGNLRLTAPIPVNTSGGQLSAFYMQGFTPMVEGIRQIRGDCGPRQVKDAELCLVTGFGSFGFTAGPGNPRAIGPACAVLGR